MENPEFVRYFRCSTRKGKATTLYTIFLVACGICLTINLLCYYRLHAYRSFQSCFGSIFFQIIGANFLLLLGFGAHACGDAVGSERQSNTLEFQRITGMNPYSLAIGKILGVPLIHYVFAAVGLPVTMLCVVCGGVSLAGYLVSYVVLVVSGLFFCSASTLASALRKGKTVQRTSPIVLLVFLLWFGPTLAFTIFRGAGRGIIPSTDLWTCLLPFHSLWAAGQETLGSYEVALFGVRVNGVAMTVVLNAFLFLLCWAGTARRLASDSQSLWTKPQLLAGASGFIVLLGSCLWNALSSASDPWMPIALSTLAAHGILLVVAAIASPGLYSFRLGLRSGGNRRTHGMGLLEERAMAFPLIFTIGLAYSGAVLVITASRQSGMTSWPSPLAVASFLVPLLLCAMAYTAGAQLCKLIVPQYGMKLFAGALFLWTALPLAAGSLLAAWGNSPLTEQGGRLVLLLSPVGACIDRLHDSGRHPAEASQFWGAVAVLMALTAWICFVLIRYRKALERRFATAISAPK